MKVRYKLDDISASELAGIIDEWVHSERDRRIVKRRFLDGVYFEPLAEEFDLSVRHTKRIIADAYKIIVKHIPQK